MMIGVVPFVVANFRWLIPLIGAIVILMSGYFYVAGVKKEAYAAGVSFERARFEQIIAAEESKNREFDERINTAIAEFGRKAVTEAASRIKKETVHTKTIETIIRDNPIYIDCKADKEVIDNRNSIRKLGPTTK
jgi:hypothetical protein